MRKHCLVVSVVALALLVGAVAHAQPIIDGVLSPGEWTPYYLGTSVTGWSGGTSVDVYGFTDGTDLWAAWEADTTTPGWGVADSLCIGPNLYFVATASSWPAPGFTLIGISDGYGQTDGSGWTFPDGYGNVDWVGRDIDAFMGQPCYGPYPANIAEMRIPLSQVLYAGASPFVAITGQYWQYDFAEAFFVELTQAPQDAKVGTLQDLVDLLPTGDSKNDKRIEKAINSIAKSLNPAYWEDASHLTSTGKKVFDEEKKAVKELMKVKGGPAGVGDAIAALVTIDAELAQIALDEAVAGGGNPSDIAKAQKEMAKADSEITKGKFDKAIDHLKHAWQKARKALGLGG